MKYRAWQIALCGVPYSLFEMFHTFKEPNGNALLWFGMAVFMFFLSCGLKIMHDDFIAFKEDPSHVRAFQDVFLPLACIWLIFRAPWLIVMIVLGICAAMKVWG